MAYNKNVPEIPALHYRVIIARIQKSICELNEAEKEEIKEIVLFHGCEPSAAAERISELLDVDYSAIFDLL